jgi:hypothetical protein
MPRRHLCSGKSPSRYAIGDHDELTTGAAYTKYDSIGSERIGCRRVSYATHNGYHRLLTDHLSSAAITIDVNGTQKSELRYKAWGENRSSGYSESATPTGFRFTGQRKDDTIEWCTG